jgi:hypothetical protein
MVPRREICSNKIAEAAMSALGQKRTNRRRPKLAIVRFDPTFEIGRKSRL